MEWSEPMAIRGVRLRPIRQLMVSWIPPLTPMALPSAEVASSMQWPPSRFSPMEKSVTAGSQDVHWSRRAQEMRLRRFMPDGRIDASFGVSGTSTADFQDMVPGLSTRAMARQADGKLVVVGEGTSFPENRPGLAVARFVEKDPDFAGLIGLLAGKTLVTANEKAAELVVRRTGGSSGAVSVAYETVDGSALAGSDYVPKVGRLVVGGQRHLAEVDSPRLDRRWQP